MLTRLLLCTALAGAAFAVPATAACDPLHQPVTSCDLVNWDRVRQIVCDARGC
jgi:hypothetical protein